MNKRPGFWPVYERVQAVDKFSVFGLILEAALVAGEPYRQPGRGRKHKLSPMKEGALLLFCMYYGFTHRETASDSQLLLGVGMDQSLISRYAERIPLGWLFAVSERLDGVVDAFDDKSVAIADSTEYATTTRKAVKRILEETTRKETVKEHIIAKYRPNSGILTVRGSETSGEGDSPAAKRLLAALKPGEVLAFLGDSAYDVEEIFKLCYLLLKAVPIVCKHGGRKKGFYRRKARLDYDNKLRKQFRGLVEGIFGGTTIRHGNLVRSRRHRGTELASIMVSVNLRALLKARILYGLKGEEMKKGDGRLRAVKLFAVLMKRQKICVRLIYSPTPEAVQKAIGPGTSRPCTFHRHALRAAWLCAGSSLFATWKDCPFPPPGKST